MFRGELRWVVFVVVAEAIEDHQSMTAAHVLNIEFKEGGRLTAKTSNFIYLPCRF